MQSFEGHEILFKSTWVVNIQRPRMLYSYYGVMNSEQLDFDIHPSPSFMVESLMGPNYLIKSLLHQFCSSINYLR